ncbi:TPA: DNA-directed RNA polymerase, subunit E'' [Candidatus Micrarchaeota archaeon]|nr:MAG: DNA-directed RNA polymerase subunit E'' [Candidatus Micrarchaeota archaeon CG1_02_51_15]HII38828.1 DNA-directed RNA polymerase, subunit E'' [Candidatus Micrarchaeota archaeon]
MTEKACRNCRMIVSGDVCPMCKDSELTKTWEGYIMIVNPEGSEVASAIGVKAPGKYALKIK